MGKFRFSPDVAIIVIVLLLAGMGVAMIYSASAIISSEAEKGPKDPYLYLKKQLLWMVLGILSMVIFMYVDYHALKKLSYPLLILTLILLLLVLVPGFGKTAGGARRWVRLGPVTFQPSELAKFVLIIFLAHSLSRKQNNVRSFSYGVLPYLLLTGLFFFLVLKQKDLGTAVLMGIILAGMLFLSGARLFHIIGILLCSLPFLYVFIFKVSYRKGRIFAFLNPWRDRLGEGYQTIQSLIALGSGGTEGLGLGHGRQKLFYLPAPHTDFIFSVIGEELGFIGTSLVIILFLVFLWQGYKIAKEARDQFGSLLASGITFIIVLQAFLNMGVAAGILPVKGFPLPFLSFGGSSLVFTMGSSGILVSIWRHRRKVKV